MLYFIKSQNYLKIGYTQNENTYSKRINTYRTHNPNFSVLDVVLEGTSKDETKLHLLLNKYSYYTEWFHDCPEVRKIWKNYTENMTRINPKDKEKESIKELQKNYVTSNKLEKIQEDVNTVFGNECIMTGDEIKSTLKEIYSYYGAKTYVEIKNLKKFGYSLVRFLDGNKFKYKITKIQS